MEPYDKLSGAVVSRVLLPNDCFFFWLRAVRIPSVSGMNMNRMMGKSEIIRDAIRLVM